MKNRDSPPPAAPLQEASDPLTRLCTVIGERTTGSPGSEQAIAFIRRELAASGYAVELQGFSTKNWTMEEATCRCGDETIPVVANPYSPGCRITAPAVAVGSMEDLVHADLAGRIAVLHGDLTAEPLMPRNYPFYRHEPHQEIVRILEERGPVALITVSPRSDFPVPVIIDGDVPLPSCTITAPAGERLVSHPEKPVTLILTTRIRRTEAANAIGRQGTGKRIVLTAHLDTKHFTPGALDNASGVAALLLLARRLAERPPQVGLEFLFINGEECYDAPGERAYLDAGYADPSRTALAINIDGIGLAGHRSAISYYACPDAIVAAAEEARGSHPDLVRGDPWPQGDHMIFSGIPAMALTTLAPFAVVDRVIHTPADTLAGLDPVLIERTVDGVEAIVRALDRGGLLR